MRLGVLSDIHASAEGLEKALALLERRGVDGLICAGDLVDGETEGEAAAQSIKNLNIPVAQGNHDFTLSIPRDPSWRTTYAKMLYQQDADWLSEDTLAYLRDLPKSLTLKYGETELLLAHGSPWHQDQYVFPRSTDSKVFWRIVDEFPAKIVILGHTHMPMGVLVGDTYVFNPGSVEANRYSLNRTCGILDTTTCQFDVYDIDRDELFEYTKLRFRFPD
jgi:putative phosphoesterase